MASNTHFYLMLRFRPTFAASADLQVVRGKRLPMNEWIAGTAIIRYEYRSPRDIQDKIREIEKIGVQEAFPVEYAQWMG